jgi:alkanesulfonate monooxygenase SsuD/methylene tetrahydromethanopterin reductase-like flavin-dependent oxidoreductase (luciferase family)
MFRLGFLTHVSGARDDAGDVYARNLELIVAAEELGYEVFWIAQHHIQVETGRLPSPFPFLAAAAERTRRIRLGTAVVALSFEHPLRVAEDAAVVDLLSGGRLELGLGSASEPEAYAAFGMDQATAREDAARKITAVTRALRGLPLTASGTRLQPQAAGLGERIWRGASSVDTARQAAQERIGLLVPRLALAFEEPTDVLQVRMIAAYSAALDGAHGHVGVSRSVYPADDKRTAQSDIRDGVQRLIQTMVRNGRLPAGLGEDEYFSRLNLYYGQPEEIVAELKADRALPYANDVLFQVDPGRVDHAQTLRALERIAREVAPALGWRSSLASV